MLFNLISHTFVLVLLLTFSFGPAFFALINTGITHGYKTGSLLAVGVVASDFVLSMLIILLIHLGASNFIHDEKSQRFMGILAGIILIVFGVVHFRQPAPQKEETMIVLPSAQSMVIKGFMLNCLNPAVWLLWLGNVTAISKMLNYKMLNMVLYFSITLGLVLLVELGKVSVAGRLKQILTPKTMHIVNIITGGLLVIFGVVLIYNHFFDNI